MKPLNLFTLCLVLLLSLGTAQAAADARSALVVDAAWLAGHIDDANLVLLHVGDADDYAGAHIPGARLVSLDDVSISEHTRDGLMLEMPAAEDLRARLEKLGIAADSRIVVYYAEDWVSPATRIVFTLQYAGLDERTALLDGGMAAWKKHGGALGKAAPREELGKAALRAKPGSLAALDTQALIVDADYVRANLDTPGIAIVDARAPVYYDGIERGGAHGQKDLAGHIKGARSIPYTSLTDAQLRLRPQAELRALFDQAGVKPGDTVIGYCHIGQQATAVLFAARLLGHPVRLYDGSFQDWSRGAANPVETTAAQGRP
jgi:thiosulfate/3-mercaptopyruvate sulfurtransferase